LRGLAGARQHTAALTFPMQWGQRCMSVSLEPWDKPVMQKEELRIIAPGETPIMHELAQELSQLGSTVTHGMFEGRPTLKATNGKGYRDYVAGKRHLPIDYACLKDQPKKIGVFMADMDSTVITAECIDEIADMLGIKEQVGAITERSMRGELNFEESLRERVALLNGATMDDLEFIWKHRIHLTEAIGKTVASFKQQGAFCVIVSGGFTFFSKRVGEAAGFHETRANELIIDGNQLTGKVCEPVLGREAKAESLAELSNIHARDGQWRVCIGDGAQRPGHDCRC
jgi:phosphoserine phosphatase SerB